MRKFLVRKGFLTAMLLIAVMIMSLGLFGCATPQGGKADPMATVAQVAATAPALAQQLDDVYNILVEAKAVPDHRDYATVVLQTLDKLVPAGQTIAEVLSQPEKFSWVQAAVQIALTAVQIMGYVAPLF